MEGFLENFESFIGVNFWTALFTLLNFLILFFVARRFLIGPILAIIENRQKEIDDMYDAAGTAEASAKALEQEYQQKQQSQQQQQQPFHIDDDELPSWEKQGSIMHP